MVSLASGAIATLAFIAFVFVERRAVNPVVPFTLFKDRNRLATFAAVFLAGGVMFTLTVLIGLYVQDIMGYSALRAGIGFIPFVIALGVGLGLSSQLVSQLPAAPAGDRRRRAGAGRHDLRLHPQRRHPVLPEPGHPDHRRRLWASA